MKRYLAPIALVLTLLAGAPVQAGDRCPLDIQTCLNAFAHMKDRPWLGVEIDTDSAGTRRVVRVVEGSPAAQAGIQPGDILEKIDGKPMSEWFAGRSGWATGTQVACVVERGRHDQKLSLPLRAIPDDVLDRMIGKHMLEEHVAFAGESTPETH